MGSRYLHNFFEGVYVLWRTKCYGLFDFENPTRIFWSLANILRQTFQIWILRKQRKYMVENLLLPDKVVECFNNFKIWSRNIFFGKKKRPRGLSNLPSTSLGEVSRSFGTCFKFFAMSLSELHELGFWRKHFRVFVIFLFGKTKTFWAFLESFFGWMFSAFDQTILRILMKVFQVLRQNFFLLVWCSFLRKHTFFEKFIDWIVFSENEREIFEFFAKNVLRFVKFAFV